MDTSFALAESAIRARLSPAVAVRLAQLSLLPSTPSTNDFLWQLQQEQRHVHAVLADHQSSGRGRRGRRWQSPPGCNIYFSLGWNFNRVLEDFSCLPLLVGVAAAQALQDLHVTGVGLKWPNDVQVDGKKLGGILVESRPLPGAGVSVVVGIGLNVFMQPASLEAEAIDQPWTSLDQLPGLIGNPAALDGLRETLAGSLLDRLITAFVEFEAGGFGAFHTQWQQLDILRGKTVTATGSGQGTPGPFHGEACGIDSDGNLLVKVQKLNSQQLVTVHAGEVSVRIRS